MKILLLALAIFTMVGDGVCGSLVQDKMNIEDITGEKDPQYDQNGEYLFGDIIFKRGEISALGAVTFQRWTGGRIVYAF